MTDAVKALRQDMEQETADELLCRQRHHLAPSDAIRPIVLVAEGNAALVICDEPRIRDRHPVSVARQIGEHRLRPRERLLDIDEPLLPAQRFERCSEGGGRRQLGEATCKMRSAVGCERRRAFPARGAGTAATAPGPAGRNGGAARQGTKRSPSSESPPPGTIMCTCGWWVSAEPQVCSTAVMAMLAPNAGDRRRW